MLHLAAIVGYPACAADPTTAETTNVDGTRILVEALSASQMLVYASTGSTYGQCETVATEETPINPLTLYGRTKRDAERLVVDKGGVGLRFATVFGLSPRLRLDLLVNDFCYQAYHNKQVILFEGHHRRTFLHARDAAGVYPFTLDHYGQMKGDVYNVGASDMNYTKIEVAQRHPPAAALLPARGRRRRGSRQAQLRGLVRQDQRARLSRDDHPRRGDPRDDARDPVHPAAVALAQRRVTTGDVER